jgi:hypothetical protein
VSRRIRLNLPRFIRLSCFSAFNDPRMRLLAAETEAGQSSHWGFRGNVEEMRAAARNRHLGLCIVFAEATPKAGHSAVAALILGHCSENPTTLS